MRRAWAISGMSIALWACGGGGEATGTTSGAGGSSSSSGAGTGGGVHEITCTGAPVDPALEGTWAATGKLAVSLVGAPGGAINICPTDQVGEANLLLLITIKADPSDSTKLTEVRASLCSLELPTVSALVGSCDPKSESLVYTQIKAPQPFLDALPKIIATPVTGTINGKGNGAPVALDRFTVTIGSTKPAPMLPAWDTNGAACEAAALGHTSACEKACVGDCASLRDDDADMFPGVTLQVCGLTSSDQKSGVPCHADKPSDPGATLQGKAFMSFQVDPKFTGAAKSSCEVAGTVDSGVLYSIVGDDIYLAGAPITVDQAIRSLPSFKVDATQSKFRMVRIDGKYGAPSFGVDPSAAAAACATLVKRVNEL